MTAAILLRNLATIRELETYYSYEDVLNMLEVIVVSNHNKEAALIALRKKAR